MLPGERYLNPSEVEALPAIAKAVRTMWMDFQHFRLLAAEAHSKIEDLKQRLLEMDKRRWNAEREVERLKRRVASLSRALSRKPLSAKRSRRRRG